jgi:hypothetical protein
VRRDVTLRARVSYKKGAQSSSETTGIYLGFCDSSQKRITLAGVAELADAHG